MKHMNDDLGSGLEDDDRGDREPHELDDRLDRQELRDRYYGLLQELRVALPGVQVLLAFLLTASFAPGFNRLDEFGRDLHALSLICAAGSTISLLTPTVFHRVASRTSRVRRLVWGIRFARLGIVLLAVAMVSSLLAVTRTMFGDITSGIISGGVAAFLVLCWLVIPLSVGRDG